jgi:hypothetical protein
MRALPSGGGGSVGFASVLTGGDLLLSAHGKAFSGRSGDRRYEDEKGSPEGLPFRPYCSRRILGRMGEMAVSH